jgi:hypothetical protein
MKTFVPALAALAFSISGAALAADPELAPPVVRKPAAKPLATPAAPAPASKAEAPSPAPQGPAGPGAGERRPMPVAPGAADAALEDGVLTVVNRYIATGRCAEAVSLATANGQAELAERAKRSCSAR